MNRTNLPTWLSGLCVVLIVMLLVRQRQNDSSGALFPNQSKLASEARALAQAAEKAGNTNLAKIYYLSAINHAPSDFSMLTNYAELVFRDSSATTEDFARLKSVLQISLYQIPPASIGNAMALLDRAIRREEQLLAAQTPKPVAVDWQKRFEQLAKSNTLENSSADLKQISRRWDGLNEIVESLHEEQSDSELTKQVERELELTQRVLAAARLATTLDTMMSELNSSSEQPEKAVSLLQSAEATLGQLWGIDSTGWPSALRSKVDQYPQEIQRGVDAVAEVKSRPSLAKVEAERDSAKNYVESKKGASVEKYGPNENGIKYYEDCLGRAVAAAQKISSASGRKKAEAAIKEIRDLATDAKRKQSDEYQKWVVGLCKTTFSKYDAAHFVADVTTFSNTKARQFFADSEFAKIDQSLLAPEISRLFSDVLGKLTTKMNGDGQFQTEKEIAETTKKKLEDF